MSIEIPHPRIDNDQNEAPHQLDDLEVSEVAVPLQTRPERIGLLSEYVVYSDDDLPPNPYVSTSKNYPEVEAQGTTYLSQNIFEEGGARDVQQLPDGTFIKFRSWRDWESRIRAEEYPSHQDRLDRGRELHTELASYGITMVPTVDRLGQSPTGELGYFMRSMPVEGARIMDLAKDLPVEVLEDLYSSLAQYYLDKLQHSGKYLNDLNNSQFVYGRMPSDTKDRVYLIDQEPTFVDVRDYPPLSATIRGLRNMVNTAESRAGVSLPRSQAAVETALAYASRSHG